MAESLCFDPANGRILLASDRGAPALDEFMKDPDRYPNYVLATDLETGKMEVLSKAEANGGNRSRGPKENGSFRLLSTISTALEHTF